MTKRHTKKPTSKPPPADPNEAAKALVDQVAALTEDQEETKPPADPQHNKCRVYAVAIAK